MTGDVRFLAALEPVRDGLRPMRMRLTALVHAILLPVFLSGCGVFGGDGAASPIDEPADGMRWVGTQGVVVAVPDWWTTGDTRCGAPIEDTVYFDNGATYDCVETETAAVREVSALAVLDAGGGYGEKVVGAMKPIGEINGVEVLERPGCEYWVEDVCRKMFAVPSKGVVFAVTIAEEGDGSYASIRDSIRLLPADMTTIPLATPSGTTPGYSDEPAAAAALIRTIKRAGLEVAIETAEVEESASGSYASLPEGSLLEVEPVLGSPIAKRGTVNVTLSGASMDPAR